MKLKQSSMLHFLVCRHVLTNLLCCETIYCKCYTSQLVLSLALSSTHLCLFLSLSLWKVLWHRSHTTLTLLGIDRSSVLVLLLLSRRSRHNANSLLMLLPHRTTYPQWLLDLSVQHLSTSFLGHTLVWVHWASWTGQLLVSNDLACELNVQATEVSS